MRSSTMCLLVLILACRALCACSGTGSAADAASGKDVREMDPAPDVRAPELPPADTDKDVAPELPPADLPPADVPDIFHTNVNGNPGYGKYCKSYDECKEYGLSCFNFGPEDITPICSKECETNKDCPEYLVCDYKLGWTEPVKACMEARYCSPCQVDSQCDFAGMACVKDEAGGRYCSFKCLPGVLSCDAGSRCVLDEDRQDYYCRPFYGQCVGDGSQCSPCRIEDDCPADDKICFSMFFSLEKFCATKCALPEDCPGGYSCFDLGLETGLCLLVAHGKVVPSCHAATQDFCQECKGDYECKGDLLCYVGPDNIGYYCSPPCKSDTECPVGTQCKSAFAIDTGAPSGNYACAIKPGVLCKNLTD